jgi:hypothetical protein
VLVCVVVGWMLWSETAICDACWLVQLGVIPSDEAGDSTVLTARNHSRWTLAKFMRPIHQLNAHKSPGRPELRRDHVPSDRLKPADLERQSA